jgi:hypothetical protein
MKSFVGDGGTLICLVGAEAPRPSARLLADFDFLVAPSPVPLAEETTEPEPAGHGGGYGRTVAGDWRVWFHAAWPVTATEPGAQNMVYQSEKTKDSVAVSSRSHGGGTVVVIGDTHFASNDSFKMDNGACIRFWRWLLSNVVAGQKPWEPPPGTQDADNATEESTP